MKLFATNFLLVFSSFFSTAVAFPSNAGACPGGMAAVGSPHLTGTVTNGTLEEGGFTVSVDGEALVPGVSTTINIGQTYTVALAGGTFKGFLFRLSTSELDAFTVDSSGNAQAADVCTDDEGVAGATHTSNSDKSSVEATLTVTEAMTDMPLDVTVVVMNTGGVSEFYYTGYLLTSTTAPSDQEGSTPVPSAPSTPTGVAPGPTETPPTSAPSTQTGVAPATPAPQEGSTPPTSAPSTQTGVAPATPAPQEESTPPTSAPTIQTGVYPATPAPTVAETSGMTQTAKPASSGSTFGLNIAVAVAALGLSTLL